MFCIIKCDNNEYNIQYCNNLRYYSLITKNIDKLGYKYLYLLQLYVFDINITFIVNTDEIISLLTITFT